MQHGLWLLASALPTPTPTPTMSVDPNLVTPGPWGFAIMAVIGIAVILLIADMLRRIRRVNYREEIREQLDAEEAAAREDETPSEGTASGEDNAK